MPKFLDSSGLGILLQKIKTVFAAKTEVASSIEAAAENFVHKSGNETIAGTKTFSSAISGSISGNAGSATQLQTARSIGLAGAMTGSASFNGTANATITAKWRSCLVGQSSSTNTNPWYKAASFACNAANDDITAVFLVESTYSAHVYGFLRVHVRTNGDKAITASNCDLRWAVHTGFALGNFVLVVPSGASPTVEIWTKVDAAWRFYRFTVLSEGSRTETVTRWTLYNASSAGQQASIPTAGTQVVSTLTGAVNTAVSTTSDARAKTDIADIDSSVMQAWQNVQARQFAFRKEVSEDGRKHFGYVAQDIQASFEAEGLDPFAYGILSKGEDGMLSVTYPEALALETECLRAENRMLKERILKLENAVASLEVGSSF